MIYFRQAALWPRPLIRIKLIWIKIVQPTLPSASWAAPASDGSSLEDGARCCGSPEHEPRDYPVLVRNREKNECGKKRGQEVWRGRECLEEDRLREEQEQGLCAFWSLQHQSVNAFFFFFTHLSRKSRRRNQSDSAPKLSCWPEVKHHQEPQLHKDS